MIYYDSLIYVYLYFIPFLFSFQFLHTFTYQCNIILDLNLYSTTELYCLALFKMYILLIYTNQKIKILCDSTIW